MIVTLILTMNYHGVYVYVVVKSETQVAYRKQSSPGSLVFFLRLVFWFVFIFLSFLVTWKGEYTTVVPDLSDLRAAPDDFC